VHASNGQKLINPEGIPFGKWKIPIRFVATDTGGGCVPGCHRSLDYDRKAPVDYSKPGAAKQKEEKKHPEVEKESKPAAADTESLETEPLDTEQIKP